MNDEKRKELLDILLYSNTNSDNVSQLIINNIPKYLYKYRSGTIVDLEALENDQLWMANATFMDDPDDSKLLLTKEFKDKIEYVVNNVTQFNEEKYKKHLRDDSIQQECFLCSLSEISDSEDMWVRYANNEQGFCIQYDALELLKNLNFPLLPVWYGKKPCEDEHTLSKMNKAEMIFKNFLIKNKVGANGEDWYAQREWRIIAFGKMLEITDDNNKGKCINAVKPSKIILGKNIPINVTNRINNWVNKPENRDILIHKR